MTASFIDKVNGYVIPPSVRVHGGQRITGWKGNAVFEVSPIRRERAMPMLELLADQAKRSDKHSRLEVIENNNCPLSFHVLFRLGEFTQECRAERKYPQANFLVTANEGHLSLIFYSVACPGSSVFVDMAEAINLFKSATFVDGNLLVPFDRTELVDLPSF